MEWSGSLPVTSRRALMALGVAAVLCAASSLKAQTPPAQTPPAAAQTPAQPPDALKFSADVPVLILYTIKPEGAADFEAAWKSIRDALAKASADKPDVKAFADSLGKMYKVDLASAPAGSPVLYVFQVDTPSKTLSYNPTKLVYETLHNNGAAGGVLTRPEADDIYKKLTGAIVNLIPWPLMKIGG